MSELREATVKECLSVEAFRLTFICRIHGEHLFRKEQDIYEKRENSDSGIQE
jgi:hypothetical protein